MPSQVEPRLPAQPPPAAVPDADLDFSITAPRRTPQPRAVDTLRFQVRDMQVVGATLYSRADLAPLLDPLVGKQASLGEITAAAEAVEAKYRGAGYVLTRAFVPPQRVADGIFRIQVVEGYVAAVAVEGTEDAGIKARILSYLKPVTAARPLDMKVVERALLLANDLPGVNASGVLRPSPDQQGAADLVVAVSTTPVNFLVTLDNRGSRYTGPWSSYGEVQANSALGMGEQILLGLSSTLQTKEQRYARFSYLQPLGLDGLAAGFNASYSEGEPGYTLKPFEVESKSYSFGPRLSYPLIRSRAETLSLDGGFTVTHSSVDVLQTRFTRDSLRVLDIRASYAEQGFLGGASSLSVGLSHGIEGLGSSHAGDLDLSRARGKPDFTKLTGELRHQRVITGPFSVAVLAQGQYAFDSLLASEEATFGGRRIGRAYDPSEISGDHGLGGSAELRWDERLDWSVLDAVQLYGFYDVGRVWRRDGQDGDDRTLASTGLGLRMFLPKGMTGGLEFAQPLSRAPATAKGELSPRFLVDFAVRF